MEFDCEDGREVIDVDSDNEQDEEDEFGEVGTSGDNVFSAPQQVFVVKCLSKATTGFRPSVTCEGYLAELSNSSTGYNLSALGYDQQLSFKYEPPSPKFGRKRPGCISYRLQLLHGSQFLYSLRGLPKELRCQRAAHALEWGPVHMVFAAASDLDTFLSTLKYVEVAEVGPGSEQDSGVANRGRESMTWAWATAQLLATSGDGDGANQGPVEKLASGTCTIVSCDWLRGWWPHSSALLAGAAGALAVATCVAVFAFVRSGSHRSSAGQTA